MRYARGAVLLKHEIRYLGAVVGVEVRADVEPKRLPEDVGA